MPKKEKFNHLSIQSFTEYGFDDFSDNILSKEEDCLKSATTLYRLYSLQSDENIIDEMIEVGTAEVFKLRNVFHLTDLFDYADTDAEFIESLTVVLKCENLLKANYFNCCKDYWFLSKLYIKPQYRRKGAAKALVRFICKDLDENLKYSMYDGILFLSADSYETESDMNKRIKLNKHLNNFYKKCGLIDVGTIPLESHSYDIFCHCTDKGMNTVLRKELRRKSDGTIK